MSPANEDPTGGARAMAGDTPDAALWADWEPRLFELCARLRGAAAAALARSDPATLAQPLHRGVGDWSFGLDLATEEVAAAWLDEVARERPLSLLTEDRGWHHRGPDGRGGARALADFDHGGPRIALDPVDGTRNLMADLRPAWTIVSAAGAGAGEPRLCDLQLGIVSELPTTNAATRRVLWARRGGPARLALHAVAAADPACASPPGHVAPPLAEGELLADDDDRCDRGYFPFFRYLADLRPAIARVEAAFFERIAREEGAEIEHCYDDQYIASGGQLALLALGTYRMIVDLRARAARAAGGTTLTSKPYDLAGAVLVAEAAGCVVRGLDGGPLDFPLDATTPVDFAGFANAPTARRLAPHLAAALASLDETC